mmetsp:Transcript_26889/g.75669  ORF Transcript_26889/g.75669 Transcript_26889/m.75669 type:complete len:274 (-) Transcript_26889:664-1485(-)
MEVRRCVHSLVQILLLNVSMAVHMDDANLLRCDTGNAPDSRESNGVITAQDDWERAGGCDLSDSVGDLIKALLYVCGDGEDVSRVAEGHLLPKVNAHLVVVGSVQGRYATDALWTEACPGAVGGPTIEGHANDSGVEVTNGVHILDVRSLQECVEASEVGKLSPAEGGNCSVLDGGGARHPDFQVVSQLFLVPRCRDGRLLEGGLPALSLVHHVGGVRVVLPGGSCRSCPTCQWHEGSKERPHTASGLRLDSRSTRRLMSPIRSQITAEYFHS